MRTRQSYTCSRSDDLIHPTHLAFLRSGLARRVELGCGPYQGLESIGIDLFPFADIDRAPRIAFQAGIEEPGRIVQRRALQESQLDPGFVGFAGAEDAAVLPDRRPHPLPAFDDVGQRFPDQAAHAGERLTAPVAELGDALFGN